MTKAQKWARERNVNKFILGGITKNLKSMISRSSCLLITEKAELKRAILFLNGTLGSWKARNELSKKKYMEESK